MAEILRRVACAPNILLGESNLVGVDIVQSVKTVLADVVRAFVVFFFKKKK